MINLTRDYTHLAKPLIYGPVTGHFRLLDTPPEKIANVNVIPFTAAGEVIMIRIGERWDLPGGTLEPDEPWQQTARREALEEAGATLTSPVVLFGGWACHSTAAEPYRPHLPHPRFFRVVGTATARLESAPLNPPGAEVIDEVRPTPVEVGLQLYAESGRYDFADLLRLAVALRG